VNDPKASKGKIVDDPSGYPTATLGTSLLEQLWFEIDTPPEAVGINLINVWALRNLHDMWENIAKVVRRG